MSEFIHLDERGAARMVDVSAKPVSARTATATGCVLVSGEVVELLRGPGVPKGDALAVATDEQRCVGGPVVVAVARVEVQ